MELAPHPAMCNALSCVFILVGGFLFWIFASGLEQPNEESLPEFEKHKWKRK